MSNALDILNFNAKGHVKITKGSKIIVDQHNDIQAFAKTAVAKLILGKVEYAPTVIKVLNNGIVLSTRDISNRIEVDDNISEMTAMFEDTSFAGNFDEVQLHCGPSGIFSKVEGINATKLNSEAIIISWTITVN